MQFLSLDEQKFIYDLYIKESLKQKTPHNGNYNMIDKLHNADLLRKVKMKNTNEIEIKLTDLGEAFAVIIAKLNHDKKLERNIFIGFW